MIQVISGEEGNRRDGSAIVTDDDDASPLTCDRVYTSTSSRLTWAHCAADAQRPRKQAIEIEHKSYPFLKRTRGAAILHAHSLRARKRLLLLYTAGVSTPSAVASLSTRLLVCALCHLRRSVAPLRIRVLVIMGGKAAELTVPAIGWAAHDASGQMSPFSFKRRATGSKDVTFAVKFCGICHSDLHQLKNEWKSSKYPMVAGHEIVGIVTEVGADVAKFKVGDHVGVGCLVNSCKDCKTCKKGNEQYCSKLVWTYNAVDFDGTATQGGYSNNMVVNEDFALKVPDNLPLDAASPLMCAGITVYSPMKHYGMESGGKNFGVVGLGGLGHMAAKIAKAMGMTVTVISTSPKKEKEARESLMADNFIVSKDEAQMKAAAKTLDFIIDTVSAPHDVNEYMKLLDVDGKLVVIGLPPHEMKIPPPSLINARRTLGGSLIGGIQQTQEMLDFCGKHNVVCDIEKIPISYVNEAMVRLAKGDVHYRFVIDIENTLKE